ncbi:MAG TPA: YceI family protein [Gemmatimonadaceae bacterium]|nr:YceI family protein [Gemmatimonadaceae bacterium]
MARIRAVLLIAMLAAPAGAQQMPDIYDVDAAHSQVGFVVRFMGMTNVRGAFADVGGTIMYSEGRPERSSVAVVIQTASINTNNGTRDRDLRSPNFFAADSFPVITFRSTQVTRAAGDRFVARGPLTIRGITREVEIPFVRMHAPVKDAWGNTNVGFAGTLKLNRKDFNILGTKFWNSEFDPGRMSIADTVEVELAIEGKVDNLDRWNTPKTDSIVTAVETEGAAAVVARYREAAKSDSTLRLRSEGTLNVSARKLMQHGRAKDAIPLLQLSAELNPTSTRPLVYLGRAYLQAGDRASAKAQFASAAKLDPLEVRATEALRYLP